MKILKWLSRATKSLAQNVNIDTLTASVDLMSCILDCFSTTNNLSENSSRKIWHVKLCLSSYINESFDF